MKCGIKSKLFFCLLLLVLSPLSPLFSEVVLTDEEYDLIMTALETSDKELTEANKEIEKLKTQLIRADNTLTERATELAVLRINSDLQSKSYDRLKQRVDLIWLDRLGFGILGTGIGFGANELYHRIDKGF